MQPELIHRNTPSCTLIKQTRQPWAAERLVCRWVSRSPFHCQSKQFPSTLQSRTSLRATKPHGRKRVTWRRIVWLICITSFHSHICHPSTNRVAGQVTSWLRSKVRLYGVQKPSLCATNAPAIKSIVLLDLLLIVLCSGCHKVM